MVSGPYSLKDKLRCDLSCCLCFPCYDFARTLGLEALLSEVSAESCCLTVALRVGAGATFGQSRVQTRKNPHIICNCCHSPLVQEREDLHFRFVACCKRSSCSTDTIKTCLQMAGNDNILIIGSSVKWMKRKMGSLGLFHFYLRFQSTNVLRCKWSESQVCLAYVQHQRQGCRGSHIGEHSKETEDIQEYFPSK